MQSTKDAARLLFHPPTHVAFLRSQVLPNLGRAWALCAALSVALTVGIALVALNATRDCRNARAPPPAPSGGAPPPPPSDPDCVCGWMTNASDRDATLSVLLSLVVLAPAVYWTLVAGYAALSRRA